MVQFGLDRLLEMFEARFGRKPTTAILAVSGFGFFTFMARVAWDNAVWPLFTLIRQLLQGSFDFSLIRPSIFPLIFSVTGVVIFNLLGALIFNRVLLPRLSRQFRTQFTISILEKTLVENKELLVKVTALLNKDEEITNRVADSKKGDSSSPQVSDKEAPQT